ncbi:MAG: glycosyltransferase family 2 protein [Candidatus Roizmanbacteria bacterium]|nr:glycosyltransferase family 2 protein [Candidatus Roizmanbacteria bacterium]
MKNTFSVLEYTMAKGPVLSILIINYNTKKLTLECLESIYAFDTIGVEVLVLDNNSSDGSVSAIRTQFPKVRLFSKKQNLGFSKGNNFLLEQAKGVYVLFLNSDIKVLNNGIQNLLSCYQNNEKHVAFMGAKLFNANMSPQPSCGPFYTLPVVFAALFLRGDYWGLTRRSPNRFSVVDWVSGACIMTTKRAMNTVGGFDEVIFMYMEEIDLLYRARSKGLLTAFCPRARFIHYGSASSNGRTMPILNVFSGFIYFYSKHYSKIEIFLLKGMLQLKAWVGYGIGTITGNSYLKKTYGQARRII